ncbi:MAG: DNA primase [Bdellovibrionaceae bacterium]|nr:DNA primase [Pseudobdellovibrionaceae bacterium]
MRFSEDFIDRVREANNLVDIISQYTQLKPSGRGLMGRCPFPDHQERTPSFSVSETKQVYQCFGCKKAGNIFTFLRDFMGMSFPESVEFLARRAGIPLPENLAEADAVDQVSQKKKHLKEVYRLAKEWFRRNLLELSAEHPVHQYIRQRGLTPETLSAFEIGYAPRDWEGLTKYLLSKGVSAETAETARLIVRRKEGGGYFDMFRGRLMFPIINTMGETLAFGGRVLDPGEQPKYLNSPETLIFEKKKILYGLRQSSSWIRSEDLAVVVEGYMDAVSLWQAGIKNVVAVMSSTLTPEQARVIRRMTANVLMLLDGDEAGLAGAERSLPVLLAAGTYPTCVVLPSGQDPDDFVRSSGAAALRELLQNSPSLFQFVLGRWMQGYRGLAEEKVKIVDKMRPVLAQMADPRLRRLYLEDFAGALRVSTAWLKEALNLEESRKVISQRASLTEPPESKREQLRNEAPLSLKNAPPAELAILALALKSRANLEFIARSKLIGKFRSQGVEAVLEKALSVYGQGIHKFDTLISLLIEKVDMPEALLVENLPALRGVGAEDGEEIERQTLEDAVLRVKEDFLKRCIQKVKSEIAAGGGESKIQELSQLQKEIRALARESKEFP